VFLDTATDFVCYLCGCIGQFCFGQCVFTDLLTNIGRTR
jgi:hypothetical protein